MDDIDVDNLPTKLLVRTLKHLKPNEKFELEFNFHLIDLKTKKIELNFIPAIPLLKGAAIGKMAAMLESESESESDYCIYIFGNGLKPPTEFEEEEDTMIHCHSASSKYSFVSKRWDAFDVPFQTNVNSIPATLFGKLYFFGRHLKVFENGWKDLVLPPGVDGGKVTFPVISDPANNRFLVHFNDSGDTYAFHPNSDAIASATANWTRVVENFYKRWTHPVTVSGNILFFHVFMLPHLVIAYDMSTDNWFDIVGDFGDFSMVDATRLSVDYMFTLPENHDVLCLASRLRCAQTDHAAVGILRLKFKHITGSNYLLLTVLDYQSYDIPIPSTVYDFLLL